MMREAVLWKRLGHWCHNLRTFKEKSLADIKNMTDNKHTLTI